MSFVVSFFVRDQSRMTVTKNYFGGCQVVLALSSTTPFKTKKAFKDQIIDHGGIVSYIVTKRVGLY